MRRRIVLTSISLILVGLLNFFSVSLAEEGEWTKKADVPTARTMFATSVVNGIIYAIGGTTNGNIALSTVEVYDPVTDTWTKETDMPTARYDLSANAVDGKIYAIGGQDGVTVEEYDTGFQDKSVESKGKIAATWGMLKSE